MGKIIGIPTHINSNVDGLLFLQHQQFISIFT